MGHLHQQAVGHLPALSPAPALTAGTESHNTQTQPHPALSVEKYEAKWMLRTHLAQGLLCLPDTQRPQLYSLLHG